MKRTESNWKVFTRQDMLASQSILHTEYFILYPMNQNLSLKVNWLLMGVTPVINLLWKAKIIL